ncbi:MAG: hypothetical protein RJA81_1343 [Planctomycetota bacterium]|jgi:histidyl-tRNA synthetase
MSPSKSFVEKPVKRVAGAISRDERALAATSLVTGLIDHRIQLAGYRLIETPVLDLVELHERKSGAAITTRILELADSSVDGPVCLRPELTVGVVRKLIEDGELSGDPVRVTVKGSVFRRTNDSNAALQQIEQVGVELLGDSSVEADAEMIALADEVLSVAGVTHRTIRIGDVGLILEAVTSAGLPEETRKAVVETLADAAASGQGLEHVENALEHWADWIGEQSQPKGVGQAPQFSSQNDLHRLFHQLVPHVVGRRSESEILSRLQRKWELSESLPDSLKKASSLVHEIGGLSGSPKEIFQRLESSLTGSLIQKSLSRLKQLVEILSCRYGIGEERILIDLSIARGIGFYSGLVFGITHSQSTSEREFPELAGGGRYDGLASVLGLNSGFDSGIGFAIGLDRIVNVVSSGKPELTEEQITIVLSPDEGSAEAEKACLELYQKIKMRCQVRFATPADLSEPLAQGLVFVSPAGEVRASQRLTDILNRLTNEQVKG